jgi:hypothetical protein
MKSRGAGGLGDSPGESLRVGRCRRQFPGSNSQAQVGRRSVVFLRGTVPPPFRADAVAWTLPRVTPRLAYGRGWLHPGLNSKPLRGLTAAATSRSRAFLRPLVASRPATKCWNYVVSLFVETALLDYFGLSCLFLHALMSHTQEGVVTSGRRRGGAHSLAVVNSPISAGLPHDTR